MSYTPEQVRDTLHEAAGKIDDACSSISDFEDYASSAERQGRGASEAVDEALAYLEDMVNDRPTGRTIKIGEVTITIDAPERILSSMQLSIMHYASPEASAAYGTGGDTHTFANHVWNHWNARTTAERPNEFPIKSADIIVMNGSV